MILPILEQALVALPLILGAYITFSLLKLPDFALESAYLFGAVMAYLAKDCSVSLILCNAVLGGALVGALVSTLSQCCKLPFLLTGIITNGLFHGLTQYLLGTSLRSFHPALYVAEPVLFGGIGLGLLILIGAIFRSQLGYSLAIYGNNPLFFQHQGVSSRYVVFFGVMLGHGLAGLSGAFFALSNGLVDLTMNFGILLLCLTTLLLGKSMLRTNRPNLLVPILGLLAYFLVQQAILNMGLSLKYFNAIQALCVLGALGFLRKKQNTAIDHLGV